MNAVELSTRRPANLNWDRCEGAEGYYGLIWNADAVLLEDGFTVADPKDIIYRTSEVPLKSMVGEEVVDWMYAHEYKLNREPWIWERTTI